MVKIAFKYNPASVISSNLPDYDSVEWYLRCQINKLHPVLDEPKEILLNNPVVIQLIKDAWYEALEIGKHLGYEDGYEDGSDDYYNGDYA